MWIFKRKKQHYFYSDCSFSYNSFCPWKLSNFDFDLMKNYHEVNWYTLIKRNVLLLIVKIIKSLFFIILVWAVYYFSNKYSEGLQSIEWLKYLSFIIVFTLLNYAFINLISSIVEYYNDLIILHEDQIIILKSSLVMKDDMEIIDIHKVQKIDWYKRWIIQNLLWYWNIVIEQQKDDVRTFHFISKPHQIINILKTQKEKYKIINNIN